MFELTLPAQRIVAESVLTHLLTTYPCTCLVPFASKLHTDKMQQLIKAKGPRTMVEVLISTWNVWGLRGQVSKQDLQALHSDLPKMTNAATLV